MGHPSFYTCCLLIFIIFTCVLAQDDDEEELPERLSYVTCGSIIKLKHLTTNYRLHSQDVSYGSGSRQQAVTAIKSTDDTGSYWLLRGRYGKICKQGTPIKKGTAFQLEHASTSNMLHSHLHKSPLSRKQEVSCFSGNDAGDNWVLENDSGKWRRDDVVYLKHADTGCYLSADKRYQYRSAISGQLEVACDKSRSENAKWMVEEGVYFELS